MKVFQVIGLSTALGLTISACGGGSNKGNLVPSDLKFDFRSEGKQSKPVSKDVLEAFTKFSKANSATVPSTNLIFDQYSGKSGNQEDFNKLSEDGKSFFKQIQSKCNIQPETNSEKGKPAKGATVYSETKSSISGAACPMSYYSSTSSVTNYGDWTIEPGKYSLNAVAQIKGDFSTTINSQEMRAKSMSAGNTMHVEGNYIVESSGNGKVSSDKSYHFSQGQGVANLADGQKIKFTMKSEGLKNQKISKSQLMMTVDLPGNPIFIVTYQDGQNSEYYVNGQPYTAKQLNEDFGMNLGTSSGSTSSASK